MTEQEFMELLREYGERFNEAYPIFSVPANWGDDEIAADIRRCIEENSPAQPDYKKQNIY